MHCPQPTNPNGLIICSSGNDRNYYYSDTCIFTCNTGYVLTGSSNSMICQSDRTWSGIAPLCRKGIQHQTMYVFSYFNNYLSITFIANGVVNCSLGGDGVYYYK